METISLHMHHLKGLSDEECWSIIKERALGKRGALVSSDLEDIGREIAKRCGGVPLVASILGGSMGFNLEKSDFSRVRHLNVLNVGEIMPEVSGAITKKLHSLFLKFDGFHNFPGDFKCLRSLSLEGASIEELPASLGRLRHLRYFDISWSNIRALPESITKLYNLQTLRYICCYSLLSPPKGMGDLVSLRHILFNDPMLMPLEIGQLTCVQTLPLFSVGTERGNQIEELGWLSQLRGELKISNLEYVRDKKEAKAARLHEKTKIYKLEFVWCSQGGLNNDEDVLEGLQPHSLLKSLTIAGYAGENFPSWILTKGNDIGDSVLLNSLVDLKLINCRKCKHIPTIGQLSNLKVLTIDGLENVKYIGTEFYLNSSMCDRQEALALFPALRKLTLKEMSNLEEWVEQVKAATSGMVFPCLEELIIWRCPKLQSVPIMKGFSSLQKLDIRWCEQLSFIEDGLSASTCIKELSIWECSSLTSIPSINMLCSLTKLEISGCGELTSLPSGLCLCTNIQVLRISNCPSLISIPEDLGNLHSLRSLGVTFCVKLTTIPDGLCQLTQLKVLRIGGFSEELEVFPGFDSIQHLHSSLEDLRLYGWEKLKALPHQLQYLTALISLNIRDFNQVEAMPQWLGNLSSLEELELRRCKKLMQFPPVEAIRCLSKLQTLRIYDCPELKKTCAESSRREWSKISHIQNIVIDNALVQYREE
ncbi:Disease resistance protein [Corchorus olitorius]|uniref:Disease resistance protein n=1 Tax=Corchorus olitorius TaxID=93759 RepID=A0A1R3KYZ1_9ROSI|nr:Disease resistance protein [Corchorus olitorius]